MVSLTAPQVEEVSLAADTVTIRFDKYMDVSTLQNSVSLSVDGAAAGTLSFPDAEADPNDEAKLYARSVDIVLPSALSDSMELALTVTTAAKSYAGVSLQAEYQYAQTIPDVLSLEVTIPELLKTQEAYITVIAAPASAAEGRAVTVSGDLEALGIAEDTVIILNSYGRGALPVSGLACGSFLLHFALSGSELTADASVNVGVKYLALVQDSILLATDIAVADSAVLRLKGAELTAAELDWTSDHPEIVNVQDGVLTAVSGGTATITGTLLDKSIECAVYVLENANGLQLPAALTEIDEEAFRDNDSIQYALLPEHVSEIGDYAFADDDSLLLVYIPASVSVFGENIFDGSNAVTVFVEAESDAEDWCRANNLSFQVVA